ncbi:CoA transferase [Candidatus Amarobacter glycogenicus]|uniref:CaiB/BaiF CoA transferase family protein n=1 Tax=Candidatus Amarobacter glycogenicus TaxID=3140699 RepID=UPI002A13E236|nr:CoA transferase [Dehalococcoidia bacterium]
MTGPLTGMRGIVLTQAWAGSYCTELLAFMGADIIQVEVRKRPDSWRGTYDAPLAERLRQVETAREAWNCNYLYNSVNLNKRCLTLDLQTEAGAATYRRLLPLTDFVVENFSPRVLGNLGFSYEQMAAVRPGVILCSLSAYGHDGPWANIPGIGGTIEPTSGLSALLGYPGGPPMNSGMMYPDAVAGLNAFAAIMAAIRHRNRTGEGQYIDLSMQEANLSFAGEAALEFLRTGRQRERMGNRHPQYAPHGIYRCAGEDKWIAIASESDAQWTRLITALGSPAALSESRFETKALRKENEDALDAAIEGATRSEHCEELAARLCSAQVPAAAVHDGIEVARDPALHERGVIAPVRHPEAGEWIQAVIPWRYSGIQNPAVRPAPRLGQHSAEVLAELLGMREEEYERLVAAGISGEGPPD